MFNERLEKLARMQEVIPASEVVSFHSGHVFLL